MILSRTIGFLLMAASTAAAAQQAPAAPQPAAAATAGTSATAKADKRLQVTCRINRDGNLLRRQCMTNEQWAQAEAGVSDAMDAMRLHDRLRCSSGAC